MKTKLPIEELLRWRLARAEAAAPPAPQAARLLAMARPWWEVWPEQFQSMVERLGVVQLAYGHAMMERGQSRTTHPVPALVVRSGDEFQAFLRVLYFSTSNGRLRFRFQLDPELGQADPAFEVTFIAAGTAVPLFTASATLSVENEYRIDAEIPKEIASEWRSLKVTDRMPFRLILRTDTNA